MPDEPHWCGKCHGNPACGLVKGDPGKLAEWKIQNEFRKWERDNPLEAAFERELRGY